VEAYSDCIALQAFSVLTPKQNVCGNYILSMSFSYDIPKLQIDALVVGFKFNPANQLLRCKELKIYCPNYPDNEKSRRFSGCRSRNRRLYNPNWRHLKQEKKA